MTTFVKLTATVGSTPHAKQRIVCLDNIAYMVRNDENTQTCIFFSGRDEYLWVTEYPVLIVAAAPIRMHE